MLSLDNKKVYFYFDNHILGQGVRIGTKQFWDFDTDYCVSENFLNDSIFCLATVYAVYLY
jgi:hypothetical protein